uniref:Uncharacterized protein n=1 Tax=Arion vulgaris TaxID=1028688 RepID=A0A0B6ZCK0_9EUPU
MSAILKTEPPSRNYSSYKKLTPTPLYKLLKKSESETKLIDETTQHTDPDSHMRAYHRTMFIQRQ